MKHVQRDTKYIIKRILIGVGIAIILANLRKCNVYADSLNAFNYMGNSVPLNQENRSYFDFGNNLIFANDRLNDELNNIPPGYSYKTGIIGFKNKNNGDLIGYNLLFYHENRYLNDMKYISLVNGNEEDFSFTNAISFLSSLDNISSSDIELGTDRNSYGVFISTDSSRRDSFADSYYSSTQFKYTLMIDEVPYYVCSFNNQGSGLFDFDYNTWEYLGGNSFLPNLDLSNFYYINNGNLSHTSEEVPNIPQGYSEINLTDYQAVYFIPKDYNDIQIETIQTGGNDNYPIYTNFIDFNYYFKGSIKQAYFSLDDTDIMVSTFQPRTNLDSFEYVDSFFPLTENPDGTGYQYLSYLIYNLNISDETIIYYNSVLFDYYLVDNMSDYQNEVCFIDREHNNKCINVIFNKTLEDIFNQGMQQSDDEFNDNNNDSIKLFLDLIKLPFNFINRLKKTSCSPLNLTLPFINYNLSLPCLSSYFKNYFKNYYSLIQVLISGILLYKVFLINFYAVLDVIKPQKSQVEVVDL